MTSLKGLTLSGNLIVTNHNELMPRYIFTFEYNIYASELNSGLAPHF